MFNLEKENKLSIKTRYYEVLDTMASVEQTRMEKQGTINLICDSISTVIM